MNGKLQRGGHQNFSGFSLLEMLTATVIFIFILAVASSGFFLIVNDLDEAGDESVIESDLATAAKHIKDDFREIRGFEASAWLSLGDEDNPSLTRYLRGKRPLLMEFNRQKGLEGSLALANAVPSCDRICFVTESGIVAYYVGLAQASPQPRGEREKLGLYRHFRPFRQTATDFGANGILRYCESTMFGHSAHGGGPGVIGSFRQSRYENRYQPSLLTIARSRDGLDQVSLNPLWPEFADSSSLGYAPPDIAPSFPSREDLEDPASLVHALTMPDRVLAENVFRFRVTPYRYQRDDLGAIVRDAQGAPIRLGAQELNQDLNLLSQKEWPCFVQPDLVEVTIVALPKNLAEDLNSGADWIGLSETGAYPIPQKQAEVSASLLSQSFTISLPDSL